MLHKLNKNVTRHNKHQKKTPCNKNKNVTRMLQRLINTLYKTIKKPTKEQNILKYSNKAI